MSTNGQQNKSGKRVGSRAQAPFRLSADVVNFLNEVAVLGGKSSGAVCEDCLWEQLPKEREKYIARKALISQNATFPSDKLRGHHHKK